VGARAERLRRLPPPPVRTEGWYDSASTRAGTNRAVYRHSALRGGRCPVSAPDAPSGGFEVPAPGQGSRSTTGPLDAFSGGASGSFATTCHDGRDDASRDIALRKTRLKALHQADRLNSPEVSVGDLKRHGAPLQRREPGRGLVRVAGPQRLAGTVVQPGWKCLSAGKELKRTQRANRRRTRRFQPRRESSPPA
jgi:hypothetical protein